MEILGISQEQEDKQTSSPADFPVSLFPALESGKGKKTTAISGLRCYELYGTFSPLSSFVKTLLTSQGWRAGIYSKRFVLTWKVKATPSNRLIFQLSESELRTEGIGFGLSLTPTTIEIEETPEKYRARMDAGGFKNNNKYGTLASQIADLLPTITARDYKGATGWKNQSCLPKVIGALTGMKLQPDFVEWLMGFPPGWTDIGAKE